jgi:hypothetical protein
MVDLVDRAEREAALARKLGKANAEARKLLMQAIEDGRIDEDEWRAISQAYQNVLQAGLEDTAFASGLAASEALGVGVDSAALHARAIEWARQYAYDLVSKLDATNRQLLQESIADYFGQRMTLADLEARLQMAFGPVRASMIATTEVTRASSEGEQAFARELQNMGLQPVLVWNTANDDIACPICAPLNGKAQQDGWVNPPPAHPNCRCFCSTELKEATR